jgi:hypothetical protein
MTLEAGMNGQGARGFEFAQGVMGAELVRLRALVPAAEVVALDDGHCNVTVTVEAGGVTATMAVPATSTGERVVLPLADFEAALAPASPPSAGDARTRVAIGPCVRGDVTVAVGDRSYRLAAAAARPRPAAYGSPSARVSQPFFSRALRSVRGAAFRANDAAPVVTVALTAVGLTFGAGGGGNVTLDTAPGRRQGSRVRVAVLPLAPLEAFAARMPRQSVHVAWRGGVDSAVTFSAGMLSLTLRALDGRQAAAAVRPDAIGGRNDRGFGRGRVIVDRARLATALLDEAKWLASSAVKPGTIVLRVDGDGMLSAISPQRRASADEPRRQPVVEVSGRVALTGVELHCDFDALAAVLSSRRSEVTDVRDDFVALHVATSGPLVVTLPGCDADDVTVRRDAVACTVGACA